MSAATANYESSLLLTLEEISQLVSHCHHPGETLATIVGRIQSRFQTDVCSTYQLEPEQGTLVLRATVGLKPESIGRVRMHLKEGLTGLVAERLAPVMVRDAFKHPRFKYFPEAGEDLYHSFLGVPLVEGGVLQGVLVVQTREPREFSASEIRMLVAVGTQLAPLLSEAYALEQAVAVAHGTGPTACPSADQGPRTLAGVRMSPGTGVGQAYLVGDVRDFSVRSGLERRTPAQEIDRLARAQEAVRGEITRLSQRISDLVGENHGAILQGQLMILQDATIARDLTVCLEQGRSAEEALLQTLDKYVAAFQTLKNPFFQERVYDIKDVIRRILWHLQPAPGASLPDAGKVIVVAREASVMDLFAVEIDRLAGVAVEQGGSQAHAAILARSLGIPMLGQVAGLLAAVRPGQIVALDAANGRLELDVTAWASTQALRVDRPKSEPYLELATPGPDLPELLANINLLWEVPEAVHAGAPGVGLFRTEFLFLGRRSLPSEEEQVGFYRRLLEQLGGRPAGIRTFDLRPEKLAHSSLLSAAASQPLDWRLLAESAPVQQLFKEQVRAILRAAVVGPARILVPHILRTEQLEWILETIAVAREELQREGLEAADEVPLGIMIEAGAAVPLVEAWAERVDYFVLGTNDLLASAFGVEREAPIGMTEDDGLHPGLLHLIDHVVGAAHAAGRPVTVCGEMAGDREGTLALACLGVDALGVAVRQYAAVRHRLAGYSNLDCRSRRSEILGSRTGKEVRQRLKAIVR